MYVYSLGMVIYSSVLNPKPNSAKKLPKTYNSQSCLIHTPGGLSLQRLSTTGAVEVFIEKTSGS